MEHYVLQLADHIRTGLDAAAAANRVQGGALRILPDVARIREVATAQGIELSANGFTAIDELTAFIQQAQEEAWQDFRAALHVAFPPNTTHAA